MSEPIKTQGQLTLEQYAQQTQVTLMSTVHLQLVSYLTAKPPVSSWPLEVRKHMYEQLIRCAQLFGPQTPDEEAIYNGTDQPTQ